MDVSITQQQRQLLSQQMIQSANILQMTATELYSYLQELSMENPVIEIAASEVPDYADNQHQRSVEEYQWLSSADDSNRYLYQQQEPMENNEDTLLNWFEGKRPHDDTLADSLWEQLVSIPFRPKDARTLKYLLESLDSRGYLSEPLDQIAQKMDQPMDRMELLLGIVQALDPPGVGARDLSECLLIQLKRQAEFHTASSVHNTYASQLALIVTDCLEMLAKNQLPAIAKKIGVPLKETVQLCQIIRGLNPKPGARFFDENSSVYIHPDVLVTWQEESGAYSVRLNDSMYPSIEINGYYRQLSKSSNDSEVQKYLMDKIHQAEWIRSCIEQRNDTLFRTAATILEIQQDFFADGSAALKPLRLADVAAILGLHESTVSRAVRNKYLQCSRGILPLSYFFSARLATADTPAAVSENAPASAPQVSAEAAKAALRSLIDTESKEKPFSDRILAEKLSEMGIAISRRTVAKYREGLGIPDASGRKHYE